MDNSTQIDQVIKSIETIEGSIKFHSDQISKKRSVLRSYKRILNALQEGQLDWIQSQVEKND